MIQLGRNAPCYCGSGKKFKKCCLNKDEGQSQPNNGFELKQTLTKISPDLVKDLKPGMDFPQELLDNFYDSYDFDEEKREMGEDEDEKPLLFAESNIAHQMHENFENFSGGKEFSSIDELKQKMQEFHESHNNSGIDDFLGLSPDQMFTLQRSEIFEKGSGLELNEKVDIQLIKNTPFVKYIEFILKYLHNAKKVKATVQKNFPRKLSRAFRELYLEGHKDKDIITERYQVQSELDVPYLSLFRISMIKCRWIKLVKGSFSLTKKGAKIAEEGFSVKEFSEMLTSYITEVNWGYADRYPDAFEIQQNAYFLLYILHKKADNFISTDLFGETILKAFPMIEDQIDDDAIFGEDTKAIVCRICDFRFVNFFCFLFGLLETETRQNEKKISNEETFCKKSELFKKLFMWRL